MLTIDKSFTFSKLTSHILITANNDANVTQKLINSTREIDFQFRTRYPNGILLYEKFYLINHNNIVNNDETALFELFISLSNGRLKVFIHSDRQHEMILGYGFNSDHSHHVRLYLDLNSGTFNIRLDDSYNHIDESINFEDLNLINGCHKANCHYNLILGGHSSISAISDSYKPLVGCMGNFTFISRTNANNHNNFNVLSSTKLELTDVEEGEACQDKCQRNLCSRKATCINFYDKLECNCFGTEMEDYQCRTFNTTLITLRGYSSISYNIYPFHQQHYSDDNLISFHLKTTQQDGLLFVALGQQQTNTNSTYLVINIKNGFLNLFFDFGQNNPKNYLFNDFPLNDDEWHNITVRHIHQEIHVHFDQLFHQVIRLEDVLIPFFHFDPQIYFGGFPEHFNAQAQLPYLPFYLPNRRFVGCLKHVYFNQFNILYDLKNHLNGAQYHGHLPAEFECEPTSESSIAMTIYAKSWFTMSFNNQSSLSLQFQFKTEMNRFQIAKGMLRIETGERRKWSLFVRNEDIKLEIIPPTIGNGSGGGAKTRINWILSNDNSINSSAVWNNVSIQFKHDGFIVMIVNQIIVQGRYDSTLFSFEHLSFGSFNEKMKFVGCVKNILFNDIPIDPRILNEQVTSVHGKISLDNCQLVNPCDRPNACEHEGICVPSEDGHYSCDCSHTGYIGPTCHFSIYRKSCEEIYLMEKQTTGIYLIDIDRNGPLPPAHVICEMDNNNNNIDNNDNGTQNAIRTIIEHNIQHQVIVREKGKMGSFYMDVHYRDFTKDMLQLFVQRSKQCEQYIRYECNNVPIGLSTYTLLYSIIKPEHKLIRLDSNQRRGCECSGANKCVDQTKECNCDAIDLPGWKHDEGHLTHKDDVAITKMFFLQPSNISWDSEAHLFLGNLSCQDFNSQKYEITFKTKESYLSVPGWNTKEMAISFKTTANKAVIFYQSHLNTISTYFKAVIISENEINFEYSHFNKKTSVTLSSSRCLNCGQWQQILIERNDNQMRVSINQNYKIFHLDEEDAFVHFDGKLFVGGAPLDYLEGQQITLGYIGCLRGLAFDNNVIDLHQYLNNVGRYPNIEPGCRPYCKPNLCKNQGICIELWGSYECKCSNPIAHSGPNCEVNINNNAVTFKTPQTFLMKEYSRQEDIVSVLNEDIIFSFRTHMTTALLFYVQDRFHNFVQIHLMDGNTVVFMFNYGEKIITQKISIGENILTNGHPVQIKIGRHPNHTIFIVNKDSVHVPYSVKLLKSDHSTPTIISEDEKSNNQLSAAIHLMKEADDKNLLFLGGINSTTNDLPGFVGCIQGLVVAGHQLDLETLATDKQEPNQVRPGCKMLCDEMPCNNGGICTEDWLTDNNFVCDCESTSYRGKTCDTDIGALFQRDSSVVYQLVQEDHQVRHFDYVDITFAFSTEEDYKTVPDSSTTLLMIQYANSSRYLHLALLPNGKLFVEEYNGQHKFSEIIECEEDNFFDSYRHWVRYSRNGTSVQVIVDSIIHVIDEQLTEDMHPINTFNMANNNQQNIIIIGANQVANQTNQHRSDLVSSFQGCISNINIILDNIRIDPLESAFGLRSGLSHVKVNGPIKQSICASFKTIQTQKSSHMPMMMRRIDQTSNTLMSIKEIWLNRPKPMLMAYKMKKHHSLFDESDEDEDEDGTNGTIGRIKWSKSKLVMVISIVYLSLVLFSVSIYLWKIDKRYRLLKFQGETPFFHQRSQQMQKTYKM